ncbi:HSPB1-associated protein 1 isoform X2 [Cavia porcellus]|uniref:HSPB1-associated protein 1 isoform X2 n=1 Tax=Cavia porcellus TaxID=10141 RepID=UPI002FE1CB7D
MFFGCLRSQTESPCCPKARRERGSQSSPGNRDWSEQRRAGPETSIPQGGASKGGKEKLDWKTRSSRDEASATPKKAGARKAAGAPRRSTCYTPLPTADQNKPAWPRPAPPRDLGAPFPGEPSEAPRGLPAAGADSSAPCTVPSSGPFHAVSMAEVTQENARLTHAAGASGDKGEYVKPFTPEKAKDIIMSLQQPAVFHNMVSDWPSRHWTAEHLSEVLQHKRIRFRMGVKSADTVPQFETMCSYVDATLEEFLTWNCDQSNSFGPFRDYDHSKFWAYADYKYFVNLFEDNSDVFQDVLWSDFGFPGRNGQESTLWIGSLGAHTPCHLDTYGCNLVFQVQGRKRWHLFPPEDTPCLYPTRIPYEESSVFSKVNVVNPDLKRFPWFRKARRHSVTLSPRQVLFVPRHWWHYVESIDPVTVSINSWIELEEDHLARVEEAITRTLVCALKTSEDPHNSRAWLNPTESFQNPKGRRRRRAGSKWGKRGEGRITRVQPPRGGPDTQPQPRPGSRKAGCGERLWPRPLPCTASS